jgi:plasmid stabilization system protein ParE
VKEGKRGGGVDGHCRSCLGEVSGCQRMSADVNGLHYHYRHRLREDSEIRTVRVSHGSTPRE